jgi:hypothetical protein
MHYLGSRLALLLLLTLGQLGQVSWAAISAAEAINLSGMQRMLSQRIAKNYLMIGSEVRVEQANRQLDESLALFDSNLLTLELYVDSPALQQQLEQLQQLWQPFKLQVLQRPQADQALQVIGQSQALLDASEALVQGIERHSGAKTVQLVNSSGRQRMLSQRIAMLYLAASWRVPVTDLDKQLQQSVAEFDAALAQLLVAPVNNAQTLALLDKVKAQWRFSQSGFRLSSDGRYVPTVISTSCDSLQLLMNQLTLLYAGKQLNAALPL